MVESCDPALDRRVSFSSKDHAPFGLGTGEVTPSIPAFGERGPE
jgi:hypothetical protein